MPNPSLFGNGNQIAVERITVAINELAEDLKARTAGGEGAGSGLTVFLLVHGLQSLESSKNSLDQICRAYAARGYAVLPVASV